MPLLKGKFTSPIKTLTDIKPEDTVYTIPHTGEKFLSQSEYEKRLMLYSDRVWTCRLTGHINLTHQEAWESENEKRNLLKNFPEYCEKPVLELVHHNSEVLDAIVDKAWLKFQQTFQVGETVQLKVKGSTGKTIEGTITKVDFVTEVESNGVTTNGECSSPQSDKENKSKDDNSPSKKSPPKMLPCKYGFKLKEEGKVINGVPTEDFQRMIKAPSKELIKLFIRNYAMRGGVLQTSPYVVDKEMVEKYELKNKFADFFFSPMKMQEATKKAFEDAVAAAPSNIAAMETTTKRKRESLSSKESSSNKKRKVENKKDKKKEIKKIKGQTQLNFKSVDHKKQTTPKKNGTLGKHVIDSSDSESEKPLSKVKQNGVAMDIDSDDSDAPLAVIAKSPVKTPKKQTPLKKINTSQSEDTVDSDDSDVVLSKIAKTPSTPNKESQDSGKRGRGRPKGSPNKRPKGSLAAERVGHKKSVKMKQMTLLDMKSKKKSSGDKGKSPKKSPKKGPYKQPPLVTRLQKNYVANPKSQMSFQLIARCARELNKNQLEKLPEDLKGPVMAKWEKIEEKKKVEKMSPEQRKEYFKQKQKDAQKRAQKKMLEARRNLNQKFEDTELPDLKPLPTPKLVNTPEGLPNELFGDIAMITEFISCYKGLLMPDEEIPIYTDALMKSVAGGKENFRYLGKVITVLLHTLLQDGIAEEYKELMIPLAEIPINGYTVSELVRLCLRKRDADTESNASEDSDDLAEHDVDDVPDHLIEQLESSELCEMEAEDKLAVLKGLVHRLMSSYAVQEYMNEKIIAATELWKKRSQALKEDNNKLKAEKKKKKPGRPTKEEEPEDKAEKQKEVQTAIAKFYGIKESDMDDKDDLATVVKRRRVMAAKAAAEREIAERELRSKRQKEAEEEKRQAEKEKMEKEYNKAMLLSKLVQRQTPIGTDRDHNRYWIFHKSTPGLYVEKGWAPKDIDYQVHLSDASSSDDSDSDSATGVETVRRGRKRKNRFEEKTCPHTGQNLWFVIDTAEDVGQLYSNLHQQGIRESVLKTSLKEQLERLTKSIKSMEKAEEKDDKEDVLTAENRTLCEIFREELGDLELRIRHGGLGGVDDYTTWTKRLQTSTEVSDFAELLKETQQYIVEKFMRGELAKLVKKPRGMQIKKEEEDDGKEGDNEDAGEEKEEEKVCLALIRWQESVDACPTWSRLHVLMGMLEACIKWEKSAENAKCKICRKKGDEDRLLLCDECNQAYHLYCMRPQLFSIPTGDWFCPGCAPIDRRRECRSRNFRKLAGYEEVSEQEEEEEEAGAGGVEHESECAVCGGDEGLAFCSTCPSGFHFDCHEPPLRHEPRSNWRCMQCKSGVRIKKSNRRATKQKRSYRYETEDDETEDEVFPSRSSRSTRNSRGSAGPTPTSSRSTRTRPKTKYMEAMETSEEEGSGDSSNEEEEESTQESDVDVEEAPRGRRRSAPSAGGRRSTSARRSGGGMANGVISEEEELKHIDDILSRLRRNRFSWPFQDPVDPEAVPDYFDIVKDPIDLQTMKNKCIKKLYKSATEFVVDIALMFDNAQLYNKPDSQVGRCVAPLEKQFCELLERYMPSQEYSRSRNENATAESKDEEDYGSETEEEDDTQQVQMDHAYC